MSLDMVQQVDNSFDANGFFHPVLADLPTIMESDELQSSNPGALVSSPTDSVRQNPLDLENRAVTEKNISTASSHNHTFMVTRPDTPDTDKTAVDPGNGTVDSPSALSPSQGDSRPTTPISGKVSRRSSASQLNANRSQTPDLIKRVSRSKNRGSPTPGGSRTPSRSRSNTPDGDRSRLKASQNFLNDPNYEMKPLRENLTSSNFIHLGLSGEINFPSANVREITIGVFHVFNPTDNAINWSLVSASRPMFRRLGTATNAAQKVEDEIFVVTKPRGFLRPKHADRVDVKFRPLGVGTYSQTYVLEGTIDGSTTAAVDAVSMKFQGISTENTFSSLLQKHRAPAKEIKFEVDETTIKIPPTRVSKQRSMGIKIINVAKETIRLTCKCETTTGPGGKFVLSLPMNSVVVKPEGYSIIPVRFQPRASGEVKGVVTINGPGKAEVKVDVIAKGILDNQTI
ncbi:7928_t:CDS:1 [Acaulospora morrowiae]|uniref:7928_t:CDS:1 n=1 Tax=Acaulospora morrowiae TaxID=94023 RepID=A0A9N9H602_9GLOM|nr:7928_t:CDS:1 [Acaulospora morrowiae]